MPPTSMIEGTSNKVYTEYSHSTPPPHPGPGWTRFVCISDTHSRRFQLPPGDVLLHSGDLSSGGYLFNLKKSIDWLEELDYPAKVIIAGNHDLSLDEEWKEGGARASHWSVPEMDYEGARELVLGEAARTANIHYLEHDSLDLETPGKTWKIYGSPAAPVYSEGAFQYVSGTQEASAIWDMIPDDIEILLTHTPAYGVLDKTRKGRHAGCHVLAKTMRTLQHCRLHLHGHIHESHGAVVIPKQKVGGEQERIVVNGALDKLGMPIIVDMKH